MAIFTLEAVQAINDWQSGGDHSQKVRRGLRLKEVCAELPEAFRKCDVPCFRQEAHEKERVWALLAEGCLSETIASWTTELCIAQQFKGGVPPEGLQGVIFKLTPPQESIVVNLVKVYSEPSFLEACERHRHQVTGFQNGIGKYGSSQHEVVVEIGNLSPEHVLQFGGFSGSREQIAELHLMRQPTAEDLEEFDRLCAINGTNLGPWWLAESGTRAVLQRMEPKIHGLKTKHRGTN